VPCHFVSTGYIDNTPWYLGVQILYTNNSAFTTETYSGKKLLIVTIRAVGLLLEVNSVNDNIPNPGGYSK
jgi:hypothetical protein